MKRPTLVAVVGAKGSGKSTFINLVCSRGLVVEHYLQSSPSNIEPSPKFTIGNARFQLIEAPGFDDWCMESWVLDRLDTYLDDMLDPNQTLAGIIYLHRLSEVRMGGMSVDNLRMYRKLCGEATLRNVVIVTNRWEEALKENGEAREQELKGTLFKPALNEGAQLARHHNTYESATAIMEYFNNPLPSQVRTETLGEGKQIGTIADQVLTCETSGVKNLNDDPRWLRRGLISLVATLYRHLLQPLLSARGIPESNVDTFGAARASGNDCRAESAPSTIGTDDLSVPEAGEEAQVSQLIQKNSAIEESGEEDKARTEKHLLCIQEFFQDDQNCRNVLETREEKAQRWLDMMQTLLDDPRIPRATRSTIFKVILRLSKRSGMFPKCLTIKNVETLNGVPVAGGSFGDVWKGMIAGQTVCLKVVRVYVASDVQQLVNAYTQEAIVWRQLKHPNLLPFVGMYRLNESEGRLCLVSPWMEQGNLPTFLQNTPRECVNHLALASDVASGLAHLHDLRIVHGDIKGLNVLITPELKACIGDFGLAHVADSHALKLSTSFTSRSKGTMRWLAPELLDPGLSGVSTMQSDMYAYGCLCYEIFLGHPPFYNLSDGAVIVAVLAKQEQPSIPPESQLNQDDEIWGFMTSCWNHDPSFRPTALGAYNHIGHLLNSRGVTRGQGCHPPTSPDWNLYDIESIRGNVEYPDLDLALFSWS
ncbi:hypothetical protein PQX77_019135 [Marasmius sp. AFHP31]|nr:hypothetical protein PQX77_019135 [Marasmius sp. AFHP31]